MSEKLERIIAAEKIGPYLIAETAYAHEGDYDYLWRQCDAVGPPAVDAIKFHLLLDLDSYMKADHPIYEATKAWLFDRGQWNVLFNRAKQRGLDLIVLADDESSLQWLRSQLPLVDAVEIHSTGLNDLHLLNLAGELGKPVFLGVGGSTLDEISLALATLKQAPVVLMYGYQSYPTDYRKLNLALMPKLGRVFEAALGYADHTAYDDVENELITIMGYVLGAPIIEKHFVLEKGVARTDYEAAVAPTDLEGLKNKLEMVAVCLGQGKVVFSPETQRYRQPGLMKKVPVARHELAKGQQLQLADLIFKRIGDQTTVRPTDIDIMLGMELLYALEPDEVVDFSKLQLRNGD
jgi:N,N'-diacetyllegionaminate synthase